MKKDQVVVKHMQKDINDINALINKTQENVTRVENKLPELNTSIVVVQRKYEKIEEMIGSNVTNSIEYVKFLIAHSKSILDQISLAMNFNVSSQLVLDVPKAAYDPSINNEISLMFTIDEGVNDGFLFFIGNGDSPDSNDYLAMEIVGGLLRFHYKLSSGDAQNVTVQIPKPLWKQAGRGERWDPDVGDGGIDRKLNDEYRVHVTRYQF